MSNNNIILVSGKSGTGKSMSLKDINNPEGVIYLNCESNKALPFAAKFKQFTVTDPMQVYKAFNEAEKMEDVHTIAIDTLTYLLDMYESKYVLPAADGRKAWGEFAQYFKRLMQQYVAESSKNIIVLAHTLDQLNEADMVMETKVPVKGSLRNQGIESYFSQVVSTKKMLVKNLDPASTDLLNITEDEEELGYKHVFQTRLTKDTINERIRGPHAMWSRSETYIDNNLQLVLNRIHDYYG